MQQICRRTRMPKCGDNTILLISDNLENLISNLECLSEIAIDWFKNNTMIVKPNKFQSIIIEIGVEMIILKLIITPTYLTST